MHKTLPVYGTRACKRTHLLTLGLQRNTVFNVTWKCKMIIRKPPKKIHCNQRKVRKSVSVLGVRDTFPDFSLSRVTEVIVNVGCWYLTVYLYGGKADRRNKDSIREREELEVKTGLFSFLLPWHADVILMPAIPPPPAWRDFGLSKHTHTYTHPSSQSNKTLSQAWAL